MTLAELIVFLEQYPSEAVVEHSFHHPHSYRGYYDKLAFESCGKTTIGTMLACAESALGAVVREGERREAHG